MTEKEYTIPLMLTVKAPSYDAAFRLAGQVADGLGQSGENVYADDAYETDNDGQRVFYLPGVKA